MKKNNISWKLVLLGVVFAMLVVLSQGERFNTTPFPGVRKIPPRALGMLDELLSPDGNWLITKAAMIREETKTQHGKLEFEVISTLNSENRFSVSIAANEFEIEGWSPDSSTIAVFANTISETNICYNEKVILLRIVDGKRLEQNEFMMPPGSDCAMLKWSPDSSKFLLSFRTAQGISFFNRDGQKVGSYSAPLLDKSWWTERGLYFYINNDRKNPANSLGDLYLLNTENYSAQLVRKNIDNPLIFSAKGDQLITLNNKSDHDVIQIWDITRWDLKKTISLPGQINEISRVYNAPVISFALGAIGANHDTLGQHAYLLDWETDQTFDCGVVAYVVGWRQSLGSALAVRGLGDFYGQIGWFYIPIRIERIPQSACHQSG